MITTKKILQFSLILCFVFCSAQAAFAATYVVTKTADTNDGVCDADCSLREAVAAAVVSESDDIIEFSPAVFNTPQTITLSGTEISITANGTLTINGPGANLLTISGNSASRIFSNSGAVTSISGMRLTGGNGAGALNTGRAGAVYNVGGGNLTLRNVVVTGNTAANGGGLNNAGTSALPSTFTLINCTVSNNVSSSSGGGMQNFSGNTMIIIDSTVSGNTSNSTGIAGAFQANGTVNISNSTFSGNNAPSGNGAGVYFNGQSLVMNNVTITNNTSSLGAGGLHKSITTLNANVRNSIIAGNSGAAATPDVLGAITSRGNNLIGAVGTSTGWVASDILNRPALLAPLANNGGPTQTHALLPSSPAINAGQNCVVTATCVEGNPPVPLTTDQRGAGFPRQVGEAVDIGAFESSFTVRAQAAMYDFDGDGKSDISVFRPSNGTWYFNQSTAGLTQRTFGTAEDKIVPADFDGDGRTDIAVYRNGTWYLQRSTAGLLSITFGNQNDVPVPADYDGDGRAELAVFRPSNGTWYFYNLATNQASGFSFGQSGDKPVPGDYDGDGKTDVAVFRPSNGVWYMQKSSEGFAFAAFGEATDIPVPADYDGDGKTNLAVFRPSNGFWYIARPTGVPAQNFEAVRFGIATDKPVPADYDGDGKADIAVFRDGVWYIRNSTAGLTTVTFGTANDKPVPNAYIP